MTLTAIRPDETCRGCDHPIHAPGACNRLLKWRPLPTLCGCPYDSGVRPEDQ